MADHGQHDDSIRRAMVEMTRGHAETALERTLLTVTRGAVDMIDGVDFADVMLISDGRARSLSPTAPLLPDLDTAQMNLRQGPCLEAAESAAMVRCTDLRDDPRWPGFAAEAVAAGVHSMMSFQLDAPPGGVGALNMFGLDPREVDPKAEAIGALLATMVTVALLTADKQGQFEAALASRDVIGQAKGMLMNHFKVDAAGAFDMLRSMSQADNVAVIDLAEQIIDRI